MVTQSKPISQERREIERYPSNIYATYRIRRPNGTFAEGEKYCPVRNWSVKGLRLTIRNKMRIGEELEIFLDVPDELKRLVMHFRPMCTVTWVKQRPSGDGFRIGCEFVERDANSIKKMRDIIKEVYTRMKEQKTYFGPERRAAKRFKSNIRANYSKIRWGFIKQKGERDCPIRNWSTKGMRLTVQELCNVGDVFEVHLNVPSSLKSLPAGFKLRCKVIWVTGRPNANGYRVGCEYIHLSEFFRKELYALMMDVVIKMSGF